MISRDTLKQNAHVLIPAIELVGCRITVSTAQFHVAEFYKLLGVDCPSDLVLMVKSTDFPCLLKMESINPNKT